ncbi:unnamed protein product [Meganyctiphanes norvegica]|uniref:Uncharacterized protein n=1 Tax=Meganyctiphanes norvegica TaxID=48144 RepID=A0AAV2RSA3_MEGNR
MMWQHHCALLVMLGATYAYSTPLWFYNADYGNADPTEINCSSFTEEYDPSIGYYSYRCNPTAVTKNPLSGGLAQVQKIPTMAQDDDEDLAEDIPVQHASRSSGSSGGSHDMVVYGSITSGRSGSRNKNNKPKRSTKRRRNRNRNRNSNRCPARQIYLSELFICIDYPSAPPLPAKHRS